MTANLQPVLKAGSTPKTILPLSGACNNKFFKFNPKILIACASAFSFSSALISRSNEGKIKRLYASSQHNLNSASKTPPKRPITFLAKYSKASSLLKSIETLQMSIASARFRAKIR